MPGPSTRSPELRDHAVRMVFEHAHEYPSQWATIRSIAEKLGVPEGLRRWVRRAERDRGERPGLTTGERQRLKPLERENVEPKREAGSARPGGSGCNGVTTLLEREHCDLEALAFFTNHVFLWHSHVL